MGISLVDAEQVGDGASVEKALEEAILQRSAASKSAEVKTGEEQVSQEVKQESRLPPKLQGKTAEEIAEMYQNLESQYGRMANDLGVQRKMTDKLLDLKRADDLAANQPKQRAEIKTDDLLNNPTEVIDRAVEERVKAVTEAAEQRMRALELTTAHERFVSKHSDYEQVAADPTFQAWLRASPYRQRAAAAAFNGDYQAADELLTDFKERKKGPEVKTPVSTDSNVQAARAAALESGTSSDNASKKGGKIYFRRDLMALRVNNPDKYYDDDYQAEIVRAYAEGRVK